MFEKKNNFFFLQATKKKIKRLPRRFSAEKKNDFFKFTEMSDKKRKRLVPKTKQQSLNELFGVVKKRKLSPPPPPPRVIYIQKGRSWGPVDRAGDRENWTRFWLDKGLDSWIDAIFLPDELIPDKLTFEKLWKLHPKEYGKIYRGGKEIYVPRWQQAYGRSYNFSGMDHKALPIPKELAPWIDYANKNHSTYLAGLANTYSDKTPVYNQILLNWYLDGNHSIGAHADDKTHFVKSGLGETVVYSISLYEKGTKGKPRILRMKPKKKKNDTNTSPNTDRLDITLTNGLVLVMGGMCQSTHTHQVPKQTKDPESYAPRFNITLRCFKEE